MLNNNQSPRLIKHIIRSYARLSENTRVRPILKENLPKVFKDKSFQSTVDETSRRWITNIFKHLNISGNGKQSQEGEILVTKETNYPSSQNQNQDKTVTSSAVSTP